MKVIYNPQFVQDDCKNGSEMGKESAVVGRERERERERERQTDRETKTKRQRQRERKNWTEGEKGFMFQASQ